MYAVIRAGGKQYRVAPGDVLRLEPQAGHGDGKVEFSDVLAVSPGEGQISRPNANALVTGEVLGEGRGKKVLVFHYKKKKQRFTAPELSKTEAKPTKARASAEAEEKVEAKAAKPAAKKKSAAPKKSAAKKGAGKKK